MVQGNIDNAHSSLMHIMTPKMMYLTTVHYPVNDPTPLINHTRTPWLAITHAYGHK